MSGSLERAAELRDAITTILARAGLENITVTIDAGTAPNLLAGGGVVVIIEPPAITYQTYTVWEYAWTASVIAGPYADPLAAWESIEPVIGALAGPLSVDAATPARYAPPGTQQYPAYQLSFTETN